ncbi:MAG: hypothetical protein GWP06_09455 [Actinobacteria bacterium]|nr:hypothetical protein [Actinomycetota bacterium]
MKYEKRISEIYNNYPKLKKAIPEITRIIFAETEQEFKLSLTRLDESEAQAKWTTLQDILFHDYFYESIENWFLDFVLEKHACNFTSLELFDIEAEAKSHLDFYEVMENNPGKGSRLKSLFNEKEISLSDISSSNKFVKWDIVLCRVCYSKNGVFLTGVAARFSPTEKDFIMKQLLKAHKDYASKFQDDNYTHFAKDRWDVFFEIESEIANHTRESKIVTPYGKLQFCELFFNVKNLDAMLSKIDSLQEFSFTKEEIRPDRKNRKLKMTRYNYDWQKSSENEKELIALEKAPETQDGFIFTSDRIQQYDTETGVRFLGNFFIDKYIARLEVHSMELAEFAQKRFAELFSSSLEYKRFLKKDMKKLLSKPNNTEKDQLAKEDEIPQEVSEKLVMDYLDNYYENLLNESIPMLENMTPREASQSKHGRELVDNWLKSMENIEERKKKDGAFSYPVSKIRKKLGL